MPWQYFLNELRELDSSHDQKNISPAKKGSGNPRVYPVMAELRERLKRDQFVQTVKRLTEIAGPSCLTVSTVKSRPRKYLEIDDLVATGSERLRGITVSFSIGCSNMLSTIMVTTLVWYRI